MLYPKRLQEDHLIDARVHGIFFWKKSFSLLSNKKWVAKKNIYLAKSHLSLDDTKMLFMSQIP